MIRWTPLLLAACVSDATQLVVEIDTDFDVPAELGFVAVEIAESGSRAGFDVVSPSDFPLSFGVVPDGRDASRMVSVTVRGHEAEDGPIVIEQRAVTGFMKHRALLLHMELVRSCLSVFSGCSDQQTCRAGECIDEVVPVDSLASADEEP